MIALLMALFVHIPTEVSQGDAAYLRMDYFRAESLYTKAYSHFQKDADVLWRLARLYVCIADVSPHEQREGMYRKAEASARKCIIADSAKAEGHTWLAASLGNIAMYEGSETKVRLAREIQRELLRAIELNPYDDVAHSILGSFYRALGNISWIERQLANLLLGGIPDGGYAEAEAALQKAIAFAPNVMRHQYEMGMLYRDWERSEAANDLLRKAARLPMTVRSDSARIREIEQLLAEEGQ